MIRRETWQHYSPLLRQITPSSKVLLILILLMFTENGLALCTPWLAGQFSAQLLHTQSALSFNYRQILFIWFILIAVQTLLNYVYKVKSGITSERMSVQLRTKLYDHLQSLPVSFYFNRKRGEILSLITYDTTVISTFVNVTAIGLIPHFITATGALICMYLIHPFVAILCGMLIPLFIITTRLLGRKIRPISKKLMQQYGRTFSIAEENLATLSIIKAYSQEQHESNRFQDGNETLYQLSSQYLKSQALLAPITRFLAASTLIAILFFGGEYIMSGALATSDIVSLMLYGMLLTRPLSSLADAYGQIQRTIAASNRLMTVFETRTEDYLSGTTLPPVKGEITLRNISFNFPGRKPLYTKLNLKVKSGETIAITGENGVGKSTIAHLLMKLHTPQSGHILIDGMDIQSVTLKSLRSQIGLVQQNVLLRNCSILDNLLFSEQDANMEAVEKAAKAARAYDFIQKLPQGFHTIIGDNGIKLSGGQKQRLSLARALLKQPAILILDEATAMFDPQGEEQFISENKTLLKEKTVLIITHRPATLALADRIYELKTMTLSLQK